jgi:hypothetical protein
MSGDMSEYSRMAVIEALPDSMHPPTEPHKIFQVLAGATIVRIGTPGSADIEGGGLVLDYILPHSSTEHRLVFGFNELGMWTIWDSLHGADLCVFDRALAADQIIKNWERSR